MIDRTKLRIAANITVLIAVIIFIFCLASYNRILHQIETQHAGKIVQAFYMIQEPNFFKYFVGGIFAGAALIFTSVSDFWHRKEYGFTLTAINILVNLLAFVTLIIVYANPVFTTFMIVASAGGLAIAATNN